MFFPPIQVNAPSFGTLELSGMSLGALGKIEELLNDNLDPRTFTVRVIYALQHRPTLSLKTIDAWPDGTLQDVVTQWAQNPQSLDVTLPMDSTCFTVFQEALASYINNYAGNSPLAGYMEEQRRAIKDQLVRLTGGSVKQDLLATAQAAAAQHLKVFDWTFPRIWNTLGFGVDTRESMRVITGTIELPALYDRVKAITNIHVAPILPRILESVGGIANITTSLNGWFDSRTLFQNLPTVGSLFENLPDLVELLRQKRALAEAEHALEESGYLFAVHLWETTFVLGFASINPRVQAAVATNKLLAATRTTEFADELQTTICQSTVLKRRWSIIETALTAHRVRNYTVSIPLLLMQLEGIIADALILKGAVMEINGKICQRGIDGKPVLHAPGSKAAGKPIEVKGLAPLVQRSDWKNADVLKLTADLITDYLAPERNKILHGRMMSYAQAHRSVRTLLCIFILARELAAFEQHPGS
jgi:hypothetical protein